MSAGSAYPQLVVTPFLVLFGLVCFTVQVQHVGGWLLVFRSSVFLLFWIWASIDCFWFSLSDLNLSNFLNSEVNVFCFFSFCGKLKLELVATAKCRSSSKDSSALLFFYRSDWPSGPLQQATKLPLSAL